MLEYYFFFNTFHLACQKDLNCALGPLFYIVYELLPISIVFIVIILADISLTSGMAYNAIFLAQILNTVSFVANGAGQFKTFYYIDFVYGIVDLDFNFPFCFWSGASALQIKAMKYVSLLYAMGLVVVTITVVNHCNCARLSRRLCCIQPDRLPLFKASLLSWSSATHNVLEIASKS